MSSEPACPNDDTLVRFLAGRTPEDERDRIGRHVDSCSVCAHILAMPKSAARTRSALARAGGPLGTSLERGDVLAERYRIVQLLGAGGMGEVYEAVDLVLNERVALKTVRATIADDLRAVERLKAEVQLARKVTHPNVCRMFDFGVHRADSSSHDRFPFLTMELLRGTTLARLLLEQGPPAPAQMADIASQIAAGLAAAHAVGVIHKDLKSDNVVLTPSGTGSWRAAVTDFGLAAAHDLVDTVDPARHFSGTPGYVAPERLAGAAATTASDVYALGVVIDDLLSGSLPSRRSTEPVLARGLEALGALARRCRSPRPSVRPAVGEILADLKRLAEAAQRVRSWRARGPMLAAGLAAVISFAVIAAMRGRPAQPPAAVAAPALPATPRATPTPATVTVVPAPPPVVASGAARPAVPHPARHRRAPSSVPAAAERAPAETSRGNAVNEPIRTLAPSRGAKQKDDAPIDIFSHAH
jgi:serine/threonine protein kinase